MKLKFYQVDAFTDKVFGGNYAGVILLDEWLEADLMQKIAAENNLSETAFAVKSPEGCYDIRWFSPMSEIAFCGHATLGTAFVIFMLDNELKEICFSAKAVGKLQVSKKDNGYIQMVFPNREPNKTESIPQEIFEGLSIKPKEVLLNQQAYFAVYEDEQEVYEVCQTPELLKKLAPYDVVVTAPSNEYDFVSRYFWPANGGLEDPVTGSIHAGLAPFWAKKLGKSNLLAFQASSRGGVLRCEVVENSVIVSGEAVLYLEGEIKLS
jgi:PhzF family phenazine biosynthesis protein